MVDGPPVARAATKSGNDGFLEQSKGNEDLILATSKRNLYFKSLRRGLFGCVLCIFRDLSRAGKKENGTVPYFVKI